MKCDGVRLLLLQSGYFCNRGNIVVIVDFSSVIDIVAKL